MPRNKLSEFDQSLREQISKNLKQLCENMTQSELSELTGIPESTISGYFAMRSTPNAGNVQKIADALGVKKSDIDPRFSHALLEEKLTRKDEREIESDLEDMMNSVAAAAFEDGSDLEDIEAFKATIKAAMIQAKKIAKKSILRRSSGRIDAHGYKAESAPANPPIQD